MKRIGNLYEKIYSIENLRLADQKARKGKGHQYGVRQHDMNQEANIQALHVMLKNKTYCTSKYKTFKIMEKKERDISCLPYFPDRIAHHAIMNILEPIFVSVFTTDTYSCIKKRGIHAGVRSIKKALKVIGQKVKELPGTWYRLKMDVRKFYQSIDHKILKELLRKKLKDLNLLWLLDEIIDSATGVPIGNYLSQYFANFYLTYFDHWIKEIKGIQYYFRYADDMLVLARTKAELHQLRADIQAYLKNILNLDLKDNYSVAPIWCGIDMLGYIFFLDYTLVRDEIKNEFKRMMKYRPNMASIASYKGWFKHADCRHLEQTYNIAA
jgi:RNA-directed DNA polymerase